MTARRNFLHAYFLITPEGEEILHVRSACRIVLISTDKQKYEENSDFITLPERERHEETSACQECIPNFPSTN
jgi:hypothetical protein